VLIIDIVAIKAEFEKVNDSELITTAFKFDASKVGPLTAFHGFYGQLQTTLCKKAVQTNEQRPSSASSGDATLEQVTNDLANHFLASTFAVIGVRDHFWWAASHEQPMELEHTGFPSFVMTLIHVVHNTRDSHWVLRRTANSNL